ncbi:MAG: hypothetical protein ACM34K_21475, partial [Bacillota bacterium]
EKEFAFYGLIDHVFESVTTNNNSTGRSLCCNCSMKLSKLLSKDNLPNSQILQNDPKVLEELGEDRTNFFALLRGSYTDPKTREQLSVWIGASPEKPIKYILKNAPATMYFKKYLNFDENDKNSLLYQKDIFDKNIIDLSFLKSDLIFNPSLSIYSGTVIDYIHACLEPHFYEMFFETTTLSDGKTPVNRMTIRPKPFSYRELDNEEKIQDGWTYWDDLDTIEFSSKYRIWQNLGVNDYEISNFFQTVYVNSLTASPSSGLGLVGTQYPVMDFDLIKRYGLREHSSEVRFLNTKEVKGNFQKYNKAYIESEGDGFFKSLLAKRDKQVEWFLFPAFESGQLTVLGNSAYKIGRKLLYTDRMYYDFENVFMDLEPVKGMEFYISRVAHSYDFPGTYTTTLGLSRGQAVKKVNEKNAQYKSVIPDWYKKRKLYKVNRLA